MIGITGTNGKTTVSYLIGEVLKSAGHKPFVLGTLNSGDRDLSTPQSLDTLRFMKDHLDQGGTHFIMEVTSEGIDQERLLGIDFDLKILTNITQDHLDYHKTFQKYKSTKLGFMREGAAHKIYPDTFNAITIGYPTKMMGDFNLLNIKAAATALRHVGISEFHIQKTLGGASGPRGRMERVDQGQPFTVLVDYAHTPDGLENVLRTSKDIATKQKGRLLVLFGCGGNRDRGKRAKMGRIASDLADFMVITDDNPRTEDSLDIMAEIAQGMVPEFRDHVRIQDRKKAIEFLVHFAQPNDVVILAGKGHETYQILNSGTVHFDDREAVTSALLMRNKANTELAA